MIAQSRDKDGDSSDSAEGDQLAFERVRMHLDEAKNKRALLEFDEGSYPKKTVSDDKKRPDELAQGGTTSYSFSADAFARFGSVSASEAALLASTMESYSRGLQQEKRQEEREESCKSTSSQKASDGISFSNKCHHTEAWSTRPKVISAVTSVEQEEQEHERTEQGGKERRSESKKRRLDDEDEYYRQQPRRESIAPSNARVLVEEHVSTKQRVRPPTRDASDLLTLTGSFGRDAQQQQAQQGSTPASLATSDRATMKSFLNSLSYGQGQASPLLPMFRRTMSYPPLQQQQQQRPHVLAPDDAFMLQAMKDQQLPQLYPASNASNSLVGNESLRRTLSEYYIRRGSLTLQDKTFQRQSAELFDEIQQQRSSNKGSLVDYPEAETLAASLLRSTQGGANAPLHHQLLQPDRKLNIAELLGTNNRGLASIQQMRDHHQQQQHALRMATPTLTGLLSSTDLTTGRQHPLLSSNSSDFPLFQALAARRAMVETPFASAATEAFASGMQDSAAAAAVAAGRLVARNLSFPDQDLNLQTLTASLSTEDDDKWLSGYLCFVRSEFLEVFRADDTDVVSRMCTKRVLSGQVGIRCRYCASMDASDRARRSASFPSSVTRIYQSLTMMLRDHFPHCSAIPREKKEKFEELRQSTTPGATESKHYWVSSAKEIGLYDTENKGIGLNMDLFVWHYRKSINRRNYH
mmetsp:Transcript_28815/g.44260  ORF Transcript_28815/g.44260 Transcript_28815/m.44260 type:complete len:694 (-) Transcript_28815:29-2110(-)